MIIIFNIKVEKKNSCHFVNQMLSTDQVLCI